MGDGQETGYTVEQETTTTDTTITNHTYDHPPPHPRGHYGRPKHYRHKPKKGRHPYRPHGHRPPPPHRGSHDPDGPELSSQTVTTSDTHTTETTSTYYPPRGHYGRPKHY